MSLGDKIFWGIIIGIMIFGVVSWVFMMVKWDAKSSECAKEYGGKVIRGYCTYIVNGSSTSFNIWEKNEFRGGD